jgi:hypothetical protein
VPETLFGGLEPGHNTAARLKALANQLLGESETADLGIYYTVCLWREPNTKNRKGGLYKIPLYPSEFFNLTIEEIRELARNGRKNFVHTNPTEFEPVPELVQLWQASKDVSTKDYREPVNTAEILNGVPAGERDNALFRLACKLRGVDIPKDIAETCLRIAGANCTPPVPEKDILEKLDNGYKYPPGDNGVWLVTSSQSQPLIGGDDCDDDDSDESLGLLWVGDMGQPEQQQFVVKPLLPSPFPTVFYGSGGSAKSYLLLDFALRYTNVGGEWLGMEIHGKGRVLYVDFELNAAEFNRRVHRLANGMALRGPIKDLAYFEVGELNTAATFSRIRAMCRKHAFDVVIIDSVGPALEGDAGYSKDVISFHRQYITPLRREGIHPILIDHQGRTYSPEEYQLKGAYGNSYKEHLARSVVQLQPNPQAEESGLLRVRLRHKKANFTGLMKPFDVVITFDEEHTTLVREDLPESELLMEHTLSIPVRVLTILEDEPAFADEIAERIGSKNIGTVQNALTRLKKEGKVEEHDREGRRIKWGLPGSSQSQAPYKENDCDDKDQPTLDHEERFV